MTLYGYDASDYDWGRGPMDMKAVYNDGIRFFTHKLTERAPGHTFYHSNIERAIPRAVAAGIPFIGAYIVPRSGTSPETQVAIALSYAERLNWEAIPGWFWQVDSEHWSYDQVPLWIGTEMCELLELATNRRALHYASVGHYGLAWNQPYPRWNPNYWLYEQTGHYKDLYARSGGDTGRGWVGSSVIWQYSDSATIDGQAPADANAFRGTEADFAAMIHATSAPSPAPSPGGDEPLLGIYQGG